MYPLRMLPVNALQQHAQLRGRQMDLTVMGQRPHEASPLQPFGEQAQAVAVSPQHFYHVTPPAAKDKQVPAERVRAQCVLHFRRQPVEAAAHNVPAGIAMIAGLSTAGGFDMAQLYDEALARPDSLTYTKTGMLFGSNVVAQTSDFRTENPQLSALLPQYVENCVIGDILLNHKYTVYDLLHSSDPLTLITRQPSPLRGLYEDTGSGRVFVTCQQAATTIQDLVSRDAVPGSSTVHSLATKLFGNKANADSLLLNAMDESYGFFYAGGLTASQIMRNNITNAAVRDGWKGFASRSSDTANLVTLATESSLTKQRLSWASTGVIVGRALPLMQSLMMLILIGLFPLVIALSLVNHSIFGLNTLKMYAGGFLYFQMWPVMYAILNSLMNYYLQTKTGSTALVLSNSDQVALQQSDAAALAGYLSASIPVMSFFLTKGAGSVASQVVGGILSSSAFTTSGQASTAADGNWSFNNMSMDNVSGNKFDTNLVERSGQQSFQTGSGAMHTQTADGHNVYDTSGAISNLPVNLRLSSLASSGFSEQSRQAQQQAQTALDGYNHSVTSGFQQMHQLTSQTGNSDTLTQGSDSSVASNVTRGASKMESAVESYAKSHNISQQQATQELMDITNQGSMGAGARIYGKLDSGDELAGKVVRWGSGISAGVEGNLNTDWRHTSGSSHSAQDSGSESHDFRHDQNSQAVKDFREGLDMVTSSRVSESGSHSDNQSNSLAAQFAATMNEAKSQYHQYTDSTTRSQEFSRMATFVETHYDERRDKILNTHDRRCENWVLWREGREVVDYENMTAALMPVEGDSDPFWVSSSRTIFSDTAMQFASDPQRNIERFLKTLLSIDLKSLREFLKNTPSANLVEEKIEKTAISIRSVLTNYAKTVLRSWPSGNSSRCSCLRHTTPTSDA